MNDTFFHLFFVGMFLAFTGIRAYYHRLAVSTGGKVEYKEGRLHTGLRLLVGIPFMLSFAVYLVLPGWFSWAALPLPGWAKWSGVFLGAASLVLIGWVQRALGSNFSTTLHVREEHTLISHGPYRWVRHPMYTVLFVHLLAILLLTANWYIGGVPLAALALIVALRLKNEENTMLEKFGDGYREYMQRTGRFLPRLDALQR